MLKKNIIFNTVLIQINNEQLKKKKNYCIKQNNDH